MVHDKFILVGSDVLIIATNMFILLLFQTLAFCAGDDASKELCPRETTNFNEFGQSYAGVEKVKFQFYYETGCPYSKKKYVNELNPAVKELAPYLDFTTYPYGNAAMFLNGSQLTIACQHGEKECYGNKLQACAIEVLNDPVKYVDFNACALDYNMKDITNDKAVEECGKKMNVNSEAITKCAKGIDGFMLLLHYGIESNKVTYPGVPWWIVNGQGRDLYHNKPIKQIICSAFKNPPDVCNKL